MNKVTELYNRFKNQTSQIKKLVTIYWFEAFIGGLADVFGNIMVYDLTKDTISLVIFGMIKVVGIYIAFVSYGILSPLFKFDLKYTNLMFVSTLLFSFVILYFSNYNIHLLYTFIFFYGVAVGIFWIGQHNYILSTLDSKNSDIYSSILSVVGEINTLLVPVLAVVSFYLSEHVFHWQTYDVLVILLVVSSLLMLFKVGTLSSFIPKKVPLRRFLAHAKETTNLKELVIYNVVNGFRFPILLVISSYIALEALTTPINIGIVETVTSVVTLYVSVWISAAKHSNNRMKLMFISIILYIISFIILMLSGVSGFGYVLFTLISIVANPLFKTSQTLMDIKTMDLLHVDDSYHLGVMFRETILFITRIVMGLVLFLLFTVSDNIIINVLFLGGFNSTLMFIQYVAAKRIYDNMVCDLPERS